MGKRKERCLSSRCIVDLAVLFSLKASVTFFSLPTTHKPHWLFPSVSPQFPNHSGRTVVLNSWVDCINIDPCYQKLQWYWTWCNMIALHNVVALSPCCRRCTLTGFHSCCSLELLRCFIACFSCKANARQRSGRAGRTGPGKCYR